MNVFATYAAIEHMNELLAEADARRTTKAFEPRKPSRIARLVASVKAALTEDPGASLPTLSEYPYA